MESAGKSLAEEVGKIAVYTFSKPVKVVIFTGSGGNGGDGFVAARYLLNRGTCLRTTSAQKRPK